jgi:hypothetical protein
MKPNTRYLQLNTQLTLIAFLALFISSCDNKQISTQDEIRQFIDKGIQAAEQRNSSELLDMVKPDYHDQKGNNKNQLSGLLRLYFLRNKSIYLFSKIKDIQITGNQNAKVQLYVAMAGKQISDITLLSNYRASIYRFELQLVKPDGDWLVEKANWARASAIDMQ